MEEGEEAIPMDHEEIRANPQQEEEGQQQHLSSNNSSSNSSSNSNSSNNSNDNNSNDNNSNSSRSRRGLGMPPPGFEERVARAFEQRLYLIEKRVLPGGAGCHFNVLGDSGNVYTVKIERAPSCSCPDFTRTRRSCKHSLFILARLLRLPLDDPRLWRRALLPSELADLLRISASNDDGMLLAGQLVRQRFREIDNRQLPAHPAQPAQPAQREVEGNCPICYEPLVGNGNDTGSSKKPEEHVVFCKACGNNVHKDCFMHWSQKKGQRKVTCIYCRALWNVSTRKGANREGREFQGNQYINLASYSEVHNNNLQLEDTASSSSSSHAVTFGPIEEGALQ